MNNSIIKKIPLFIGITIAISLLLLFPYFFQFFGDFSHNSGDWGDFGSYFGGVVGSLATVITLIWIVLTFKNQVEEQKKQKEIESLEKQMFNVRDEIRNLMKIEYTPKDALAFSKLMVKHSDKLEKLEVSEDDVFIIHKSGYKELERNRDLFSILNMAYHAMGAEKARKFFYEDDLLYLKKHLLTFKAFVEILIFLIKQLMNLGYEQRSLFLVLTTCNQQMIICYQLGIVSYDVYEDFLRIQSIPYLNHGSFPNVSIKLNEIIRLQEGDKYKKLKSKDIIVSDAKLNKETHMIHYEIEITSLNEKYKWYSGALVKIEEPK